MNTWSHFLIAFMAMVGIALGSIFIDLDHVGGTWQRQS